jgi:hypothetical protein
MHAASLKPRAARPWEAQVSRNIIEAIRYSFDFIDAATEYAYALMKGGPDGDTRPDNWLKRYIDRKWSKGLDLSDKLGLLSFFDAINTTRHAQPDWRAQGFWINENERLLFEDLKHVRNALTHPGIFGKRVEAEYADYHVPPTWSKTTVSGKMKRREKPLVGFAEHPEDLGIDDARRAVEIALRHAERFEQLIGAKGKDVLFGVSDPRTGKRRTANRDALSDETAAFRRALEWVHRASLHLTRKKRGSRSPPFLLRWSLPVICQ